MHELIFSGFEAGFLVALSFGFLGVTIGYSINLLKDSLRG